MTPTSSTTRQLFYAAALTTGIALMGMLAGCALPESTLAAPGFPHASRRTPPTTEPTIERVSTSSSDTRLPMKKVASAALFEAVWTSPPPVEP